MKALLPATFRPHFPTLQTREMVIELAAFSLTPADIAIILKCREDEVKLHYEQELAHGLMRVNARVQAVVLHKIIHERDGNMAKLWLLNKAGWRTGDGPRATVQVNQNNGAGDGQTPAVPVVERRQIMGRILDSLTAARRLEDNTIDVTPVTPPRGRGGAGPPSTTTRHR